jgi:hypothetical protein
MKVTDPETLLPVSYRQNARKPHKQRMKRNKDIRSRRRHKQQQKKEMR